MDEARTRARAHLEAERVGAPLARTYLLAVAGRADEARESLSRHTTPGYAYGIASVHAVLGDRDAVRRWLRIVVERNGGPAPGFAVHPDLKPYTEDPEIGELLDRIHRR
jgi:hypothetical protein